MDDYKARQLALQAALDLTERSVLATGSKADRSVENVLAIARQIEAYLRGQDAPQTAVARGPFADRHHLVEPMGFGKIET